MVFSCSFQISDCDNAVEIGIELQRADSDLTTTQKGRQSIFISQMRRLKNADLGGKRGAVFGRQPRRILIQVPT